MRIDPAFDALEPDDPLVSNIAKEVVALKCKAIVDNLLRSKNP